MVGIFKILEKQARQSLKCFKFSWIYSEDRQQQQQNIPWGAMWTIAVWLIMVHHHLKRGSTHSENSKRNVSSLFLKSVRSLTDHSFRKAVMWVFFSMSFYRESFQKRLTWCSTCPRVCQGTFSLFQPEIHLNIPAAIAHIFTGSRFTSKCVSSMLWKFQWHLTCKNHGIISASPKMSKERMEEYAICFRFTGKKPTVLWWEDLNRKKGFKVALGERKANRIPKICHGKL